MFHNLPKRHALTIRSLLVLIACVWLSQPSKADFVQQGPKFVGTGASGASYLGYSVAVSADGNTAVVGAPYDASSVGAAWIFVRSNGAWTQQGGKLVGANAVGVAQQGTSVAISADGNTVLIGGPADNSGAGASWVFVRSGTDWSPQGKLFGSGAVGTAYRGHAVALSADGNTAAIGGSYDNSNAGAVWFFTRSAGTWTQQGSKQISAGESGAPSFGFSIALSGDGNTALVGGYGDNAYAGAAWVFTRNAGSWSQFGNKLVGTGAIGKAYQGYGVALSADGKTAAVGGYIDNSSVGAVWVYTFNGATWTQQSKLVGTGNSGGSGQGVSVALSSDGDTLLSGGYADSSNVGATWVFTRNNGAWSQLGSKLGGSGYAGTSPYKSFATALSADGSTAVIGAPGDSSYVGATWFWERHTRQDFDGGGKSDIVWRNTAGDNALWFMNGSAVSSIAGLGNVTPNWYIVGQRDFNGDGKSDLLWASTTGDVAIWLMNGSTILSVASLGNVGANWGVAATADFNGDGKGDILWRNTAGDTAIWLMNGTTIASVISLGNVSTNWSVAGTAFFGSNSSSDILWRNTAGDNAIWFMTNGSIGSVASLSNVPTNWSVVGVADFNGDGRGDILWRNTAGDTAMWLMNSSTVLSVTSLSNVPVNWSIVSNGDYNGDGKNDILWRNSAGDNAIWLMNGATVSSVSGLGNVPTNWSIQGAAAN